MALYDPFLLSYPESLLTKSRRPLVCEPLRLSRSRVHDNVFTKHRSWVVRHPRVLIVLLGGTGIVAARWIMSAPRFARASRLVDAHGLNPADTRGGPCRRTTRSPEE